MNRIFSSVLLTLVLAMTGCAHNSPSPAPWIADRGDGTYQNPVLYADYSDPDVIRVGDDFYLVSSSFTNAPGLPVLHSRDLVNWTILTYALPRLVPEDHFNVPRHGDGVWAPAIRFHNNLFYIYYPDPDYGIYCVTATDPAGPWSKPTLVQAGKGLIDPCPFWDDDGSAYLIHAWANSRARKSNHLTLCRMSPDGTHLLDDGQIVIDGRTIPNWATTEGPKLYKRDGWYYVFAPAGGVEQGWQAVFRSKSISGPYEHRKTLAQGSTPINGPHQGAWVETASGQDWFLHFQDRGPYGRVVLLEPMTWRDGWPVMGVNVTADGTGEPVLTYKKPDVAPQPIAVPQMGDEFDGPALGLAWQWGANPVDDWFSLSARSGWLRLKCMPLPANLAMAPNLLMQKLPAPDFSATTELEFHPEDGDVAGLFVTGANYTWIGIRRQGETVRLCLIERQKAVPVAEGNEQEIAGVTLPKPVADSPVRVQLRLTVRSEKDGHAAACSFEYSLDGKTFQPIAPGHVFHPIQGRWVGAKMGLFAGNSLGNQPTPSGYADFDYFRVTVPAK